MQIGDLVVPKKTRTIVEIQEIELIGGETIYYTTCNKSYHKKQVESLELVYDREVKKSLQES